ncbi:MAG: transporter substrate-binding domain-containing protein [Helicobacteraceae bacterium]|jgi:polar amino acid transport system substrate-binding protein|nr:transporter substrate-binding domain-containing protein [Helicobacteraceae bacterium]
MTLSKSIYGALLALILIFSGCGGVTPVPTSTIAKVQQKGELVLGTSGNMTPMTRQLENGDVVGLDIDLANVMAAALKVKLTIKVMPLNQLATALANGDIDVVLSNYTMTPERNAQVAFVGPYLTSGKCLITKIPDLADDKKSELAEENVNIAVIEGSTSEAFAKALMKKATVIPAKTQDTAIEMVRSGRADAMLTDFPLCQATVFNNPDDQFVSIFSRLTYEPIGIAVKGNDTHFINWTQNFLERMDKTGYLAALGEKWMSIPAQ